MSHKLYEDLGLKGTFYINDGHLTFDWGLASGFTVMMVDGDYTYDEEKGIASIEDLAIEDDPRDISMSVSMDKDGILTLRYPTICFA